MAHDPLTRPAILAIVNQKGGVGKTTTTINLGAALAENGHHVLVIDLDPQGNASTGLGISHEARSLTTYDVILGEAPLSRAVLPTDTKNLAIVPATTDLSSADLDLMANDTRSFLLRKAFTSDPAALTQYDYILIDCPPSLNILTVNAMVAAQALIVPLQSEFFALEGLSQLILTVRDIRQTANPALSISGIVLTMYDGRNNLSLQVEEDARDNMGDLIFKTVIPRNVRLSEAPSFAMPILTYDSASKGSQAYRALAAEVAARTPPQKAA